ncbi:DUF1330 domain-containing protein [Streptomyces sp. SAS_267]|uniref:DUF1330 domain-containing protein n=1 Tax=unclassified Streptomyces TaxID=2593676 RepID=UPI0036F77B92
MFEMIVRSAKGFDTIFGAPSFEQAVAAHGSAAYQEALGALSDGVERDFRIVEGVAYPAR